MRRIDLQFNRRWIELFLLELWPQSGVFDSEICSNVKYLDIKVIGHAVAMDDLIIDHLKARLRILGLLPFSLRVNFDVDGMSAGMKCLVLNFSTKEPM
jgi:hypothetical protein